MGCCSSLSLHQLFSFEEHLSNVILDFNEENINSSDNKVEISSSVHSSLKLKLIELSEEDEKNHKEYLERMKEETGIDPLELT